ncbi:MAG: VOC family protein, partial [Lachnospiraceae bacterium]|nr:VOC family protein [Lachnospiraceae bacterium]
MITTMNHISFTVSDLMASVEFYEKVLGLRCISFAERDETFSS